MSSIRGPVFTIFTPFDENGAIDFRALEGYIEFLTARGAKQFYMMPYNGRYSQLSSEEIREINAACIRFVKKDPDCSIIVSDPIHASTQEKLSYARESAELGADYFSSIMREKYFTPHQVIEHYSIMATAGIPIVAHAMPFLSGYDGRSMDWPGELFHCLRDVEGVVAIKEDSKDVQLSRALIDQHGDRFDIMVAGRKSFLMNVLGGPRHAYINGVSMLDPHIASTFWSLLGSSLAEANRFIIEVDDPFWDNLVRKYGWHRVNKASLESAGLMSRRERMPMPSLTNEEMKDADRAVTAIAQAFEAWRG